ncbi:UNVERIFIED_ORG: hypothetical protein ABIC48_000303 [Burkholderia territorii]
MKKSSQPFELEYVDRTHDRHQSPDYLALNPNGLIPVLVDGDLVLYETAAICLHLADWHPGQQLAPDRGTPERAQRLSTPATRAPGDPAHNGIRFAVGPECVTGGYTKDPREIHLVWPRNALRNRSEMSERTSIRQVWKSKFVVLFQRLGNF